MATSIQTRGGRHQLRVKHALLPRDFFFTFPERPQAEAYRDQLVEMLGKGVVPAALLTKAEGQEDTTALPRVISGYEAAATPAESELPVLKLLRTDLAKITVAEVTYPWVESFVKGMKTKDNLAPGTIRKRVGALARAMDWHFKSVTPKGASVPQNPLRMLPRGYSQYTAAETALVERAGGEGKVDETRDRRLLPDEEHRCRLALSGTKRVDRERPLAADPELADLFDLILDTGIRLSEGFRLRIEQVDTEKGVLRLEGSKAARGQRKPRVVPLKKHLRDRLRARCKGRKTGLVFSFWDGTLEGVRKTTNRLSARFSTLFEYAAVGDFTEHDLRHEATCRWFELRDDSGRWMFSEIEVCRIMGWTSTKMALRYASLRGEDLADRLL